MKTDKEKRENEKDFWNRQWGFFKYGETQLWEQTPEQRSRFSVEKILGLKFEDLKGKTLLDAGCGDGEIAMFLSKYCKSITAVDYSDVVKRAKEVSKKKRLNNVKFIQADIFNLPFKDKFDIVHCRGVLHHNPDPQLGFSKLCRHLKPNGRMGIWLYRKDDRRIRTIFAEELRKPISKLPPRIKTPIIRILSLPFLVKQIIVKRKIDWDDRLLHLYDAYSHKYASKHIIEEIEGWFKDCGLKVLGNNTLSYSTGFSIYGELPKSKQ